MKLFFVWLAALVLATTVARAGGDPPTNFHVQLVRGGDEKTPPAPDAKAVGAKLSQRLSAVFKWRHYWELKRASISLQPGCCRRVKLSADREVELKLVDAKRVEILLFRDGKLTRVQRTPIERAFTILGGDKDDAQSWFIVVRRDTPLEP